MKYKVVDIVDGDWWCKSLELVTNNADEASIFDSSSDNEEDNPLRDIEMCRTHIKLKLVLEK